MGYSENDLKDFEKEMMPAVKWIQKHGCPHDKIIIQYDGAELVSGEMFFHAEVPFDERLE